MDQTIKILLKIYIPSNSYILPSDCESVDLLTFPDQRSTRFKCGHFIFK